MTAAAIRQVTTPKKVAWFIAAFILLSTTRVFADDPQPLAPHTVVKSGDGTVNVPSGTYRLPMGSHILDGTSWQKLDDGTKQLQEQVTRYKAENDSLKKSLNAWQPGWGSLILLTGLAIAGGTIAYYVN